MAAFHGIPGTDGRPSAFVDLAFAQADAAPGAAYPALGGISAPRQGYRYQAMATDQAGRPYVNPYSPTPRVPGAPSGPCTNPARFGFTAFPSVYYRDGQLVFIVSEDGIIWLKDTGTAVPILNRAGAAPPGIDTTWSQFGG